MCDPMTALSIAGSVSGFMGQQQMAKSQNAANQVARQQAINSQRLQIQGLQNQEEEDAKKATQSLLENSMKASATAATARVSAGESGVSGLSVDALLGDIDATEDRNKDNILATESFQTRQRELQREGIVQNTQSTVQSLPTVEYPSFFSSAVAGASDAYSTYNKYKK